MPESPKRLLGRLTELSDSWLRFYEDIGEEGGLAAKMRSAKKQGESTAGLKQARREAVDRLRALQRAVSKLADRLDEVDPEGKGKGPGAGGSKGTKTGAEES